MSLLRLRRAVPSAVQDRPVFETIQPRKVPDKTLRPLYVLGILFAARVVSALFNIIHDCDEVYNYWEPLHYLLYGYGKQTWEYSVHYALRSYLYLLLHAAVAAPAAVGLGSGKGKVLVFLITKAALGFTSAVTEAHLYRSTCKQLGYQTGNILLLILVAAPGMFFASTSLLPSSFTMYALTAAAAYVLEGRPRHVVTASIVGVVWGWPVAGMAFTPYAVYVLFASRLPRSFAVGIAALLLTVAPVVLLDRLLYGTWTVSLWNFIQYNVVGGGESALYGTEGPSFYLRNGINNLNLVLLLVLAAPFVALIQWLRPGQKQCSRLYLAVAPVYVWLAAVTALPHKEERFLYVTYPVMCLAAAAVLAAAPGLVVWCTKSVLPRQASRLLAGAAPRLALLMFLLLSASRTAAILGNYGAPMHIYRHLPEASPSQGSTNVTNVCVGAEWYRFPSSFFLPSPAYRLAFIPSSFSGLLPTDFDVGKGGTAAAPASLNSRNQQDLASVLPNLHACEFLVTWQQPGEPDTGWDIEDWEVLASRSFVDAARSPSWLARAFYIPWYSARHNAHVQYVLLKRAEHHSFLHGWL